MEVNTEDLEIKKIIPEYYKENLELLNTVIKESHFLARINEISYKQSQEFMDYFLKLPNAIYLIALYEEKLVGHIFAIPRVEELISHIVNIGYTVKSDYRNKGIGSILMQQLILEINRKLKVKIMFAEVASDNIASQNLLKKYSFEEIGRLYNGFMRKNYTYIDLVYFSKYL